VFGVSKKQGTVQQREKYIVLDMVAFLTEWLFEPNFRLWMLINCNH